MGTRQKKKRWTEYAHTDYTLASGITANLVSRGNQEGALVFEFLVCCGSCLLLLCVCVCGGVLCGWEMTRNGGINMEMNWVILEVMKILRIWIY